MSDRVRGREPREVSDSFNKYQAVTPGCLGSATHLSSNSSRACMSEHPGVNIVQKCGRKMGVLGRENKILVIYVPSET